MLFEITELHGCFPGCLETNNWYSVIKL